MIRLLAPEDFALWKSIRLEALREHPQAYGGSYDEDLQKSEGAWVRQLEDNYVFVYMDAETPVGVAGYFSTIAPNSATAAKLFTVYVKKEHRGRGVMDWLLGALEYHARDQGIEQLHLDVGTYNESAIRCYERNGFKSYGTEPRALKVDGVYIDEHLMVKYL